MIKISNILRNRGVMLAAALTLSGSAYPLLRLASAEGEDDVSESAREILNGIDYIPSQIEVTLALGDTAQGDLLHIARGEAGADDGQRLRAYRALGQFPSEETQAAFIEALQMHPADTGVDLLYVKVALDGLAQVAKKKGAPTILPYLQHSSRDVRAAAALAVGTTGSIDAVPFLRQRLAEELQPQVQIAISEAIRLLTPD